MNKDRKVTFEPLSAERRGAYLRFAAAMFGERAYQASQQYLDWLYAASPLSRGWTDCRLAVMGEEVVACIHTMRMRWRHGADTIICPSIHNTMVHPAHRSGAGGLLIAQSFRERSMPLSRGQWGRLPRSSSASGLHDYPLPPARSGFDP